MSDSDTPQRSGIVSAVLQWSGWRLVVPLVIMLIALIVLRDLSRDISPGDLRRDLAGYGWERIALSIGAMGISYLALALYDPIILRSLRVENMPGYVPVLTGVSSMAVSNLLGFSWLTGGAIRYRIYAAFGVDIATVAKLIATSWLAFLLGLLVLLGGLFAFHPTGLSGVIHLPDGSELLVGCAILAGVAGVLIWTARGPKTASWRSVSVTLPAAKQMIVLMGIALIDLTATALTLYVLLPPDLAQNFVLFFVLFIGALGLGVVSHAPGGLGVFEAAIIAGLGGTGRSDLLVALVCYRVIYTVLPFVIAVVGLAAAWGLANRDKASAAHATLLRATQPIVPILSAALALLSGAALLLRGDLPAVGARALLEDLLPLGLVETSHLLASVAGVLLLIVARGLYRRMARAWFISMALLASGLVLSLLKGAELENAMALALALAVLWSFRSAFYRVGLGSALRLNMRWLISVALLVVGITWIGFFAYRNVTYSDAMWWQFAWNGDAPRFLRATIAVTVVLIAVALNSLISRSNTRLMPEPIPDVVRRLTKASYDTEAALALTGDKRFLIAPGQDAYLAYADTGASLIAKGDPVGDPEAGEALIWALRDQADRMGRRCAFYAVQTHYLPTYIDLGLSVVKIGEIARVPLAGFSLDGAKRKDWRHAKARAARDGYAFAIIPAAQVLDHLDALRAVSDTWLALKSGSEKAFALGAFDPAYLCNFDHAVLRHVETGRIASFATLLRSGTGAEVAIDLMRYDPETTPAAMDGLFADMMLWARDAGYTWFSLGAAPLAGLENRKHAPVWNRVGGFIYTHGERFYKFEGLRSFKQKFDPVWSPNYLASPGRMDAARTLYEVNTLISGGVSGVIRRKKEQ
ncbi:bifunctional lysylphosphatidylglycerol flippase/synthetase MprF [Loktanella salsilacus]|uniref:bifunctional lysylphosphatidylglycerol flippase/synthetase MprF n=1 Tax=Loktanella salsilacus TaxID=195913 RepID=UPI0020B7D347|nr:bifunctional lysylphosphatidylglycerol flippase/synthetase MprF [Loktanella salsilacus]UTH43618.1 bifunctional lysylphosphatidylglycerol flippase/synthetase MprF [Loktanella salsilacus]